MNAPKGGGNLSITSISIKYSKEQQISLIKYHKLTLKNVLNCTGQPRSSNHLEFNSLTHLLSIPYRQPTYPFVQRPIHEAQGRVAAHQTLNGSRRHIVQWIERQSGRRE